MSDAIKSDVWKKAGGGHELTCPSGQSCRARRPGIQTFITRGMIPNQLMPLIEGAISGKEVDVAELAKGLDLEKIQDMMGLFDAVTIYCVMEPKVLPLPPEDEERDDDAVYVDMIEMDDKMFIFQWAVGGTSDLEEFRKQSSATVDAVRASGTVEMPPL